MGGEYPDLWDVELASTADKQIGNLPGPGREEALDLLIDLAEDPFLPGAERLRHYNNRYKVRFGRGERYRMLYDVFAASRKVVVGRIELRGPETYTGMDRW